MIPVQGLSPSSVGSQVEAEVGSQKHSIVRYLVQQGKQGRIGQAQAVESDVLNRLSALDIPFALELDQLAEQRTEG